MRKLFLQLFILNALFLTNLMADFAVKYNYETNYAKALDKAKKEKKDIVFVLVSGHCPWCDRLKEEVLSLEHTNEILHKYYIPVMQYSGHDEFPNKFDTYVVPTVHIISYKDESIIESIFGYNNSYGYELFEIIEKKN